MDFFRIQTRESKLGMELVPDFVVGDSDDLMVQGHTFYAIWDHVKGLWSRAELDVQRLVDEELHAEADKLEKKTGVRPSVKSLRSFTSQSWAQFRKFVQNMPDNFHPLDSKLVWQNTEVKKKDFASRKLPYAIGPGPTDAWDEMLETLYAPQEREKIEWAIGSIVSGDSKKIQKFFVFYGPAGTGKSTILNIIEMLFEGYTTTFDARALGSANASFATEAFKSNPLVAIQHDGDLSGITDNSRLNSIISHEQMTMNEKYKSSYTSQVDATLFIGSNQPVRITDAKSGLIRRLIDVHPTGVKLPAKKYTALLSQIEFELGAIAQKCLDVYLELGKNYYNGYRPTEMMLQTDIFYNFIEAHYDLFKAQGYTTATQAYSLYKEFCAESSIDRPLPLYKFRSELRDYFDEFHERGQIDGQAHRNVYQGFSADKFKAPIKEAGGEFRLVLEETVSLLDEALVDSPAQEATADGVPGKRWVNTTTTLADVDTRKLHFVKVPPNRVVIDFDLKDQEGAKALERNLEAASLWPPTYAELSKSGEGIHLHFDYEGDTSQLAAEYAPGIEIKVFTGDSSLRRRLSRCNAVPVAQISSGLPLKAKKEKMLEAKTIQSEKGLRALIERNLKKEIHPGTKPSVDFISKILDDAYESGMVYDVTDLRPRVVAFAANSSNQAQQSLKVVQAMKWASESEVSEEPVQANDDRIAFYDVEVYPNLFVICWKFQGSDEVVKMVNPKAHEVEELFRLKLVGFYNRRYDNHIVYAASMGYTPAKLFDLSTKLVENNRNAPFAAAYSMSYADIWDFSSIKQSLKKFEIQLGILHMELDIPWDQPVDEKDWDRVVEYCANDVRATEAVFEDRKGDFVARQILAGLGGKQVNDTTQNLTAKIIFGDDRKPQSKFNYTDLSQEFPGYKFEMGKSEYKGEDPGEGGYVYAEPGLYEDVVVLDVASMHPASIVHLNLFGPYTVKFEELMKARLAIKRGDFATAREMLDGKLKPYLEDETVAEQLSYALKIVINTVYGLTSAKFENPFRDNRNVDNIVAKRGALFMIELKAFVQSLGYPVVHIKTDSIKIPHATKDVIEAVMEFGRRYGYTFEFEQTYRKFCLVNDAVYIAQAVDGHWEATGAQFQHPYVFKTLFSHEPVGFEDFCEAKSVNKGQMYLDRSEEGEPSVGHMRHIGKTGLFVPVTSGGGTLYRYHDEKFFAVSGTKNYTWQEADAVTTRGDDIDIDMRYFNHLAEAAIETINKFGSFEDLVKG